MRVMLVLPDGESVKGTFDSTPAVLAELLANNGEWLPVQLDTLNGPRLTMVNPAHLQAVREIQDGDEAPSPQIPPVYRTQAPHDGQHGSKCDQCQAIRHARGHA